MSGPPRTAWLNDASEEEILAKLAEEIGPPPPGWSREQNAEQRFEKLQLWWATADKWNDPELVALIEEELWRKAWMELAYAVETGRIQPRIAEFVCHGIKNALDGHPPRPLAEQAGHQSLSPTENSAVRIALAYAKAAEAGKVDDKTWKKSICKAFDVQVRTYMLWRKNYGHVAGCVRIAVMNVGMVSLYDACLSDEDWRALLRNAGNSTKE